MKRRRPAFLMVFHSIWIALATAVLLSSCTVVPTPSSYTYRQTVCPPGVGTATAAPQGTHLAPGTVVPAPEAQNAQPNPPPATTPPLAQTAQTGPATCYTAVPNSYTYDYYPGAYAYPAYPYYPPYYAPYYGPSIGIYGGWGWGYHHRHW